MANKELLRIQEKGYEGIELIASKIVNGKEAISIEVNCKAENMESIIYLTLDQIQDLADTLNAYLKEKP